MKIFLEELGKQLFLWSFLLAFTSGMLWLWFADTDQVPNWVAYISFPWCLICCAYTNYQLRKEKLEKENSNGIIHN